MTPQHDPPDMPSPVTDRRRIDPRQDVADAVGLASAVPSLPVPAVTKLLRKDPAPAMRVMPWAVLGGGLGAVVGGVGGFQLNAKLNEGQVIGFGNIPEELLALLLWTLAGAALLAAAGALAGYFVGRAVHRGEASSRGE
jgi:hypothetical protein